MFKLDKSLGRLELPATQVVKLFRSMRDVQLALPGLPSQEASAYLCQYRTGKTVATVAAFHLTGSNKLIFYVSDPQEVASQKASGMLAKGLDFVESMGFLLTDMDVDLMPESDREMLWTSLPIYRGTEPAAKSTPTAAAGPAESNRAGPSQARKAEDSGPVMENASGEVGERRSRTEQTAAQGQEERAEDDEGSVDELLAAVENLRTGRPGVNASIRKPPSPEELKQRRARLRENLGRLLASL